LRSGVALFPEGRWLTFYYIRESGLFQTILYSENPHTAK